jgi:hypothetical protein
MKSQDLLVRSLNQLVTFLDRSVFEMFLTYVPSSSTIYTIKDYRVSVYAEKKEGQQGLVLIIPLPIMD